MWEQRILQLLAQGKRPLAIAGCTNSHLALILARLAISEKLPSPLTLLTATDEQAQNLVDDLSFFLGPQDDDRPMDLPPVMHLPALDTSPYAEISPDRTTIMRRLTTLFRLSQGFAGPVLVSSLNAWRRLVIPPSAFSALCEIVAAEEEMDRDDLVRRLEAAGYSRVQVVEDPGTYTVRGGLVDFFPPLHRQPVRLEFFGDLVESIRTFDPAAQRTLRAIEEVYIHPVRETIRTGEVDLRQRILSAADEAQQPSNRTRQMLEELDSGRDFFGIEALCPAFHEKLVSLAAYLPKEAQLVVVDHPALAGLMADEDARYLAAYQNRLKENRLSFAPEKFFLSAAQIEEEVAERAALLVGMAENIAEEQTILVGTRDNIEFDAEMKRARVEHGQDVVKIFVHWLRRWLEEDLTIFIAGGGRGQVDRLAAILKGYNLPLLTHPPMQVAPLIGEQTVSPAIHLLTGNLSQGFSLPQAFIMLTDEEIFGPKAKKGSPRRLAGPGVGDLRELRDGNFVVHSQHGVGKYHGLIKLNIRGVPADFLLLEYAGSDKLYLPIYRLNLVQKFSAADGLEPKLDRLGGITWEKKKGKVKAEVRQFAEELLQLYAQRASLPGIAYPDGGEIFSEFEATFPFSETPDQAQAIADVLSDMHQPHPMDRLVCGDVGFGKTEIALRAAFLAALAGKQVAVLAPTTVLVEQHFRTFRDRLHPYPALVESLSRFRKADEIRDVVAGLAAGKIDIVIGTHRLLSSDVRFKNLGLLIIDEEQRFGVTHKEKLKKLRTQVDVLTLTATPIPRTMHMGMMGMREISIIATPPVDRLAIRTFVSRYDDALVADGIRKELDRGGQIFFVHNRVETINEWAARLSVLVPQARVAVGHGQMNERELEKVMVDFVAGKYDILVCTAIIESGLDIPRANTMFINRADCFGLAQLYQLRGRIGRSHHRAFCYLLVPGLESLTSDARQRLYTLQRFTELGSGFSVASHDLEIRGAGDLLGARQHGHIAAVGFEAYARILEEAVAELKGQPITQESDPEINTHIAAFIPDDYIEDTGQRLDLYKRLSDSARDEDRVLDLLAEIRDRYGERPGEVEALGELMIVKGLAARLGASVLDISETRVAVMLGEQTPLAPDLVIKLISGKNSLYRLTPEMRLIRTLTEKERTQGLTAAKNILRDLLAHANQPA